MNDVAVGGISEVLRQRGWRLVSTEVPPMLQAMCSVKTLTLADFHFAAGMVAGFERKESEEFSKHRRITMVWKWPGDGAGNSCGLMFVVHCDEARSTEFRVQRCVSASDFVTKLDTFGANLWGAHVKKAFNGK